MSSAVAGPADPRLQHALRVAAQHGRAHGRVVQEMERGGRRGVRNRSSKDCRWRTWPLWTSPASKSCSDPPSCDGGTKEMKARWIRQGCVISLAPRRLTWPAPTGIASQPTCALSPSGGQSRPVHTVGRPWRNQRDDQPTV